MDFLEKNLEDIIFNTSNEKLKQKEININSFLQAVQYCTGIQSYITKKKVQYNDFIFSIVLIGQTINLNSSFCYLPDLISSNKFNLELYTYEYSFDGIKFELKDGFKLINEGF
jgi:hypothetical protein